MDLTLRQTYPVDIILPEKWWNPVIYRLKETLSINGTQVPLGFETDAATTPRWMWIVFPPVCRYLPAAILHDYLLKQGVGWRVANLRFRQTLKAQRVTWWRRALMVGAVEAYGAYRRAFHGDD